MGISMTKLEQKAPELVDMRKAVNISLEKAGLANTTAKVALCIDRSGSMQSLYSSGAVQRVAESTLALASAFDDDGDIDMFSFDHAGRYLGTLDLSNYHGGVDRLYGHLGWGSTNYADAIRQVSDHYADEGSEFPAYVLFLTDGQPDSVPAADQALQGVRTDKIFWQFVGVGPNERITKADFPYLNGLRVPHAGFIAVGTRTVEHSSTSARRGMFRRGSSTVVTHETELAVADDVLYDSLLQSGYSRWLSSRP